MSTITVLLQYTSSNQDQNAAFGREDPSAPQSKSTGACLQAFFHWVPCSQRRRRVAIYQARTGKALGLKDRHLLAHQSVLVEQRSTDRPSSTVSSVPAVCSFADLNKSPPCRQGHGTARVSMHMSSYK